jgi:hypothetical protein
MIECVAHFVDRVSPTFGAPPVQMQWLGLFADAKGLEDVRGEPPVTMMAFAMRHRNGRVIRALLGAGAALPDRTRDGTPAYAADQEPVPAPSFMR